MSLTQEECLVKRLRDWHAQNPANWYGNPDIKESIDTIVRLKQENAALKGETAPPFHDHTHPGYCPHCNTKVISIEKRPDGNSKCEQGHVFPSSATLKPLNG